MKIERTKNATKNIIFGLILKLYQILVPFAIRTVMIKFLGIEYLGLNSLFTSILQVLNLAELGIGSAMVFSMYKPIAIDDNEKICALMNLYKLYYRIIGLIVLIIGLVICPFVPYLIKGELPAGMNVYVLYLLNLLATVFSYWLFAYKNSILQAHQRQDVISKVTLTVNTIQYILQIIAICLFRNYYLYVVLLLLAQIVINIYTAYKSNKLYPHFRAEGKLAKSEIKEINQRVKDLFTAKLGSVIINSADSIVISAFLGLNTLAIYSNYYYIMNAIIVILAVVYNAILASIGNSLVTENIDKNHNDFMIFTFGNNWLVGWGSVCLLCLYQPFMEIWMGRDMMFPFSIVIIFTVYFYSWMFNKIGNTYKNAAGMWREDFWKPYVSSVVNLILNIILVNTIGISGVLISTIVATVFIETPWETYVLYKYMFKRSVFSYIKQLCSGVVVTILSMIVTYSICSMIFLENIVLVFIIRMIICFIVPNIIYILCFCRTKEFSLVICKVKSILQNKISKKVLEI